MSILWVFGWSGDWLLKAFAMRNATAWYHARRQRHGFQPQVVLGLLGSFLWVTVECGAKDDARPQKQWETSKTWLEASDPRELSILRPWFEGICELPCVPDELSQHFALFAFSSFQDPQRTTDALKVIENFLVWSLGISPTDPPMVRSPSIPWTHKLKTHTIPIFPLLQAIPGWEWLGVGREWGGPLWSTLSFSALSRHRLDWSDAVVRPRWDLVVRQVRTGDLDLEGEIYEYLLIIDIYIII